VFKQLRNLLLYDIIFLQETKLLKYEANALRSVLKGYQIYYNNHPENDGCNPHRAGTITAIRSSILKDYTIVNHNTFPGHIQATTLTNKHNSALPSLNLINVYLDSSGDIKKKEKQLKCLFKLSRLNLTYLGGDFNLRVNPQVFYLKVDDTSGTYITSNFTVTKPGFPIGFQGLVNQKIKSTIAGDDFIWNVGIMYLFSNTYQKK
jgi:hypothetical protein